MTLLIRCIAILTVLLGLALMAVSTYAAKEEQGRPYVAASQAWADADGGDGSEAEFASELDGADDEGATGSTGDQAPPTPTVVLRYAPPIGAGSTFSPSGGGRGNLSPGARTWRVLSIKPSPAPTVGLGLDIPPDQLAVMLQVSIETDVPWQILAAIAKVESDFGRNMSTSWAGAIGYGQFLPVTWADYGNGGDPYDYYDVIPAMGRYLVVAGAPDDLPGAIYAYNHSLPYVTQVLQLATTYGYGRTTAGSIGSGGLIWPVTGPLSTLFTSNHGGIDIDMTAAPGTPVLAAHDGVVLFAGGDPCCSYGLYVMIVGPDVTTLYAHMDRLDVVDGQVVTQGEPLGPVGCTGLCTGVHLHFEVIEDGSQRDPQEYLP